MALLVVGSTPVLLTPLRAQVPETLSYQGVLHRNDGMPVVDGDYDLTFRIYDRISGGDALWTETKTAAVIDGTFNTILGTGTGLDLPFDKPYWLGIQIGEIPSWHRGSSSPPPPTL